MNGLVESPGRIREVAGNVEFAVGIHFVAPAGTQHFGPVVGVFLFQQSRNFPVVVAGEQENRQLDVQRVGVGEEFENIFCRFVPVSVEVKAAILQPHRQFCG